MPAHRQTRNHELIGGIVRTLAYLGTAYRRQELEFGCSFTFPSSHLPPDFHVSPAPSTPARRIDLLSLSDKFTPTI